jgi:hypothetical protein
MIRRISEYFECASENPAYIKGDIFCARVVAYKEVPTSTVLNMTGT